MTGAKRRRRCEQSAYLVDDVDVTAYRGNLVLDYANLLEETLHVLALAPVAALEVCLCHGFRHAEVAQTVHHLNVAAGAVLEQQPISDTRNF